MQGVTVSVTFPILYIKTTLRLSNDHENFCANLLNSIVLSFLRINNKFVCTSRNSRLHVLHSHVHVQAGVFIILPL